MILLKHKRCESWLHPVDCQAVAARYFHRLYERCRGRRRLFITLTYDRKPYKSAADLYRAQSDEKHVAMFMRRLSRHLKKKLTGKWVCKMEFQEGGWVHFHLLLLDETFIPHEDLMRLWGHGFVDVQNGTKGKLKYLCKYVFKDGKIPAFLLFERPRSVKIIRTSPGFWPKENPETEAERAARLEDERIYREYGPPPPQQIPGYECIGARVSRPRETLAKVGDKVCTLKVDLGALLNVLMNAGVCIQEAPEGAGWLAVDCSFDKVLANLRTAQRLGECGPEQGPRAAGRPRSGRPFHLIETGNRDTGPRTVREFLQAVFRLPWVDQWFREDAESSIRQPGGNWKESNCATAAV
ncbi:hypothetical protein Pan181_20530 [Aeoliella mucimassa]|uniref:Replication-associated protein ORF2/G2P domain-containing protein n=2 Tax=Aeoliella mucimassa TaxID=2527972 RepID=A0A518AMC0_9BACT|nr:hypothetical protein Pan181_20530 [Aeoliella mucimassa]